MNPTGFATLAAAITNLAMGLLVYSRGKKNKVNISFAVLSFLTSIWAFSNFIFFLGPSLIKINIVYATGSSVLVGLLFWTHYLLKNRISFYSRILVLVIGALLFIVSLVPGFNIKSLQILPNGSQVLTFADGFILFTSLAILLTIYIGIRLTRGYFRTTRSIKSKLKFVFLGLGISILIVLIVSLVLPLFGINLVSPIDAQSSIFFVGFSAYAIMKHKFLNIKIIFTQFMTFLLELFLLGRIFFSSSVMDRLINIIMFLLGMLLGIILIRSVIKEVRLREETEQINNSLRALRDITRKITQSLDFSEVTQELVDEVSSRLKYKGALVLTVGKDKKTVQAVTLSSTPIFNNALKILPQKFNAYKGSVMDGSLSAKVLQAGRVTKSNKLSDFVSPALDPKLANRLQKKIGIQSLVAVPVTSEDIIKGVLIFGLAKPVDQILDREISTMKSLGDQLGIVTRNIEIIKELKRLDQAKSDFLSIASHQLRTPITATKGYISMILEGDFGKVPATAKKALDKVYIANNRLINLINDLLNVSRIEKGRMLYHMLPQDIGQLIKEVVEVIAPQTKQKGLKLNVDVPKDLPEVLADKEKLRQMIMNLTDNAIKYTQAGHIDLTIKKDPVSHTLLYSVKDTGMGIAKQDLSHLFKRFSRGTNVSVLNTEGTGLGLYVTKQIATAHHANVWAESEGKGKGAQIYLEIPYIRKKE